MSINLYVKDKKVDLARTPTWVTYMALYNRKGKKRNWKDTRYIYLKWLESKLQGRWESRKEYMETLEYVNFHAKEVISAGKLKFYAI